MSRDSNQSERILARAQVHNGDYKDERDIVIGFDFGTSSSKIIIRDSVLQNAYAIPFNSLACPFNQYLIPTSIYINKHGQYSITPGGYSSRDLKINLMEAPTKKIVSTKNNKITITAAEFGAAYIALVIQYARDWFLQQTESIYKNTNIHWHVNIGIPSKDYSDQKLKQIFRVIVMAAWKVSRNSSPITIRIVKECLKHANKHLKTKGKSINDSDLEDSLWLHPDYVNTHPEVIMEVVGYTRSPSRANGLHLLVDIGATTFDTATFIIHNDEQGDLYTLQETSVEKFGTMILHQHRIKALQDSLQARFLKIKKTDPTLPLPKTEDYAINTDKLDIAQNDELFLKNCYACIGEVIRNTQTNRDPHSRAWDEGLPVFICGGGGRSPEYRDMVILLGENLTSRTSINGFNIQSIPMPEQLDAPDLSPQDYDRLAVAYGLSFTADEIGSVVPPSDDPDVQKRDNSVDIEDKFIDKDMC